MVYLNQFLEKKIEKKLDDKKSQNISVHPSCQFVEFVHFT